MLNLRLIKKMGEKILNEGFFRQISTPNAPPLERIKKEEGGRKTGERREKLINEINEKEDKYILTRKGKLK